MPGPALLTPPHSDLPTPGATAAELTRLAHNTASPHLLEAVARHPNTPVTLLGELAARYPEAVLDNPALPLLRLAHGQQIRMWTGLAVSRLAAVDAAPEWVQELAMRHPEPQARWAVAGRARLSQERLKQLAGRGEWQLRAAVAQHPALSAQLIAQLSADAEYSVRLAVSARSDLPPEVRSRLHKDPHPLIRRRLQMSVEVGSRGGRR